MKISPAFTAASAFPPSFGDHPLIYMWAVFGLLLLELLALEWAWRIALTVVAERKVRRLRDPITVKRAITFLLLMSPILGGLPDLVVLMMWPEWTPVTRELWSNWDRKLDGFIWVPFSAAWLLSKLAGPMIDWQLVREPLPINLWPKWEQLVRPLKIGAGVLVIAFGLTFLR